MSKECEEEEAKRLPRRLQPLALRSSNFSCNKQSEGGLETIDLGQENERGSEEKMDLAHMVGGGDDMVVVGAGAGRVAAEKDLGAVEAEGVVKGVEHLGGDQTPGEEHVRPAERALPHRGRRHRIPLPLSLFSPLHRLLPFFVSAMGFSLFIGFPQWRRREEWERGVGVYGLSFGSYRHGRTRRESRLGA